MIYICNSFSESVQAKIILLSPGVQGQKRYQLWSFDMKNEPCWVTHACISDIDRGGGVDVGFLDTF